MVNSPQNMHLVIGASGLVGKHLIYELNEKGLPNCGTFCNNKVDGLIQLDIKDRNQVGTLISAIRPSHIYIPASMAHVDACEQDKSGSYQINVNGVKNIVDKSLSFDSKIIYISSDYVFDGKSGPYSADDICNPVNEYGRQKVYAENYVALKAKNSLIVRTCGVFGNDSKNFVARLAESLLSEKPIKVPSDQFGTPTYAKDLAIAILDTSLFDRYKLVHFTNLLEELLSRYDFAIKVAKSINSNSKLIEPIKTEELKQFAPRPMVAGLRSSVRLSTLDSAIDRYFDRYFYLKDQLTEVK